MKRKILLLTILLVSFGAIKAQTNLISDPGFETSVLYPTPDGTNFARISTFGDLGANTQTGNPTISPAVPVVKNQWYRRCIANSGYPKGDVITTDKQEGNKSARLQIQQLFTTGEYISLWGANTLVQFVDIDRTKKYHIAFYAKNILNCDSLFVGLTANSKLIEGTAWVKNIISEWVEYTINIDPTLNPSYTNADFDKTALIISQVAPWDGTRTTKSVEIFIDNVRLVEGVPSSLQTINQNVVLSSGKGMLNLSGLAQNDVDIYNVNGTKVKYASKVSGDINFSLIPGVYIVQISNELKPRKVIVN